MGQGLQDEPQPWDPCSVHSLPWQLLLTLTSSCLMGCFPGLTAALWEGWRWLVHLSLSTCTCLGWFDATDRDRIWIPLTGARPGTEFVPEQLPHPVAMQYQPLVTPPPSPCQGVWDRDVLTLLASFCFAFCKLPEGQRCGSAHHLCSSLDLLRCMLVCWLFLAVLLPGAGSPVM